MPWLVGRIYIALILCFLLGLVLGLLVWVWRRRVERGETERIRYEAEAQAERLKLRISALEAARTPAGAVVSEAQDADSDDADSDDAGDAGDADDSDSDDDDSGGAGDAGSAEIEALSTQNAELNSALEAATKRSDELEQKVAGLQGELDQGRRFQVEAKDLRDRTSQLETDLAKARSELEAARRDVERYSDKLSETQQELDALRSDAPAPSPDVEPGTDESAKASVDDDVQPADVSGFEMPDTASWQSGEVTEVGTPAANHLDDLKKINGIGPVLERTLNGLGIQTWEQIAAFTPDEVDRVNEAMNSFKGRIERDQWMDGARELLAAGHEPGEDTSKRKPSSYRGPKRSTS